MNGGNRATLRNLCGIYNIPEATTGDSPQVAFRILIQLYGMPLIRDHAARRRHGNECLGLTSGHFAPISPFVRVLGGVVVMMQEFPHYFTALNQTTAQMIETYRSLNALVWWLERLGLASSTAAVGAGAAEAIKTGRIGAGVVRGAQRAAGYGNLTEAVVGRAGGLGAGTARAAGAVGLFATAAAGLSYVSAQQQMAEIRKIMRHRLQGGQASNEQYAAVFGDTVDPSYIKRYWEIR